MRLLFGIASMIALAPAAWATDFPVVEAMPGCAHEKLGTVAVSEGTDVSLGTKEIRVASASYPAAFRKLANAGAARGANTLVLRGHEATFFTKARYRSPRPVHVRLHAAAIRIHQPAACRLETLAPQALQRRAIEGEALNVIADPGAPTT